MIFFQYLDLLPAIPEHLINNIVLGNTDYITKTNLPMEATYSRHAIGDELIDWLHTNISIKVELAGLQKMTWTDLAPAGKRIVRPHCDRRRWAVNYIIETGGPEVTTTFYKQMGFSTIRDSNTRLSSDNKLSVLEQKIIEPNRWHILNTNILHGVENVCTQRRAITIGLNSNNPFNDIRGYSGLFDF